MPRLRRRTSVAIWPLPLSLLPRGCRPRRSVGGGALRRRLFLQRRARRLSSRRGLRAAERRPIRSSSSRRFAEAAPVTLVIRRLNLAAGGPGPWQPPLTLVKRIDEPVRPGLGRLRGRAAGNRCANRATTATGSRSTSSARAARRSFGRLRRQRSPVRAARPHPLRARPCRPAGDGRVQGDDHRPDTGAGVLSRAGSAAAFGRGAAEGNNVRAAG